jgi:hypothetical protein
LPPYGFGDTIGFGVDFRKKTMFFTKNGERLIDAAFENVAGRLYPCLGMFERGKVRVNFGPDFMWLPGETCDFNNEISKTDSK